MESQRELFHVSGPFHLLNSVDWRNTFHRRSVIASLVQGVKILEKDRQRRSIQRDAQARAPQWWEGFHFQLNQVLVDDKGSSYGAIFELKYAPDPLFYQSTPTHPKYVIAFRGRIRSVDQKLTIKLIFNKLEKTSRFHKAFEAVRNMVMNVGPTNVWLAGHSLGASMAMLAGRNMMKDGYKLDTYLFNPPFLSLPVEKMIKNQTLKHGVRIAGNLLKVGTAKAINLYRKNPENSFRNLSEWTPYMFVNPSDPICAEYIGYFQHRMKMEGIGFGRIERTAARYTMRSLVSGAVGRDSEPLHLLPTAYMTVNTSPSENFKQAHGIHQWWQQHLQWQFMLHEQIAIS
ncbi:unnamed protein product [Lactuca saligna]|uniref:Fungal lipase-type domain-containing protein n=1 Tax=Lactuca saligna TaxID=75948 RepID=A0AA36A2A8_LACSI|nr:unnamed protein product [Lactuca saligna]